MAILFNSDWKKYPSAVIHETTKNYSFKKMHMVLKDMGIVNNYFMLALHDKGLMDIDPHSKNLSEEMILRIAWECRENPWYFFREVVRVQADGGDPVPFKLHRGNMAMIWCFMNYIHYFSVQSRQSGKTIAACAIMVYVIYIMARNTTVTLFTKDSDLIHANVGRVKVIRDNLPKYLTHKSIKDANNKEGLTYTALGNKYLTKVAQPDKQGADNAGRGMSSSVNHLDELAYITNIDITYPVMMFATIASIKNAEMNDQPRSNILTTTAGRIDTKRGQYAYEIMKGAMPFTEQLYDCLDRDSLKEVVRANSSNDMVNGTFSYLQLGYDHKWFEDTIRITKATQEEVDRDILCLWKAGSETGLIPDNILKILIAHKSEPAHVEIIHNFAVSWYIKREIILHSSFASRQLIMGMDSSEQIGRDFTTFVIIDAKDMAVVATFRCNESNVTKLAMFIGELLIKYRNITFIPERKSTGLAIIDTISIMLVQNNINPFRRIYNKVVQERHTEEMRDIKIDDPAILDTSERKHLGFVTSGSSRPLLYKMTLQKATAMNARRIYDSNLISELSTLATINGRIDHKNDGHDDMVIAYLLACWLLYSGDNLEYYGIKIDEILSGVIESTGESVSPEHRKKQLELRTQIKQLETLIKNSDSSMMTNHYRQKIEELKRYIDQDLVLEPLSNAKMLNDISSMGKGVFGYETQNSRFKTTEIQSGLLALL